MTDLEKTKKFYPHIPSFVDYRGEQPVLRFETLSDLLSLPEVRCFAEMKGHDHFALSENALMHVADGGLHWWVVGHVSDPTGLDLRRWAGWKFRALLDGKEVILGEEVVSSCGDVLTLRDGRIATALLEEDDES